MTAHLLSAFVFAELSELWDAEHEVQRIYPHMIVNCAGLRTRRVLRERSVESARHLEQFQTLLRGYEHTGAPRCCTRVRQWVADYTRMAADPLNDAEAVASAHLLKIDDFMIAGCTLASRCAQAVADLSTVQAVDRIQAEKSEARNALVEAMQKSGTFPGGFRLVRESGARHRCWLASAEFSGDEHSPVLSNPRHSPTRVPELLRDAG